MEASAATAGSSGVVGREIANRLRERYGLTAREVRVALLIAEGHVVKDVSAILEVSIFTVRAHLRRIFMKTGVNRQAALVRLLLTDGGKST